jgi:hypothetical protein
VIEPIHLDFEVACPPDRAFAVWTEEIDRWWPSDHTVTGTDDLTVVFEPRAGGRIFERTPVGYLWHLRRDRADATQVEVRFEAAGEGRTRVAIEHRGWEALGAEGEAWRDRNHGGWATLLPWFVERAEAAEPV